MAECRPGQRLLVSAIEHPCVLKPAQQMAKRGWALTPLPVDAQGRIDALLYGQAMASAVEGLTTTDGDGVVDGVIVGVMVTLGVIDGVGAGDGGAPEGINCPTPFRDVVDDRFNINGVIN